MENTASDADGFPPDDSLASRLSRVLERLDTLGEQIDRMRAARNPDGLRNREEAAERLRISIRKLDTLTAADEIQSVKIGRCVRYRPVDLDAYIARLAREGRS